MSENLLGMKGRGGPRPLAVGPGCAPASTLGATRALFPRSTRCLPFAYAGFEEPRSIEDHPDALRESRELGRQLAARGRDII